MSVLTTTCERGASQDSEALVLGETDVYKEGLPLPLQLAISIEQSHYNLSSKSNRFGPRSSQTSLLSFIEQSI
jgi:hypothetical protein